MPFQKMTIEPGSFRDAQVCACGDHGFVGLTRGLVAFLDPEDVPSIAGRAWRSFTKRRKVYAVTGSARKGTEALMHREIEGSEAPETDHADGDGLNNRRGNLRAATHSQNRCNRGKHRAGATPFKGVRRNRARFSAEIKADGRRVHLGTYDRPEEAARAYDRASREYHGDFGLTNEALGLLPPEEAPHG